MRGRGVPGAGDEGERLEWVGDGGGSLGGGVEREEEQGGGEGFHGCDVSGFRGREWVAEVKKAELVLEDVSVERLMQFVTALEIHLEVLGMEPDNKSMTPPSVLL